MVFVTVCILPSLLSAETKTTRITGKSPQTAQELVFIVLCGKGAHLVCAASPLTLVTFVVDKVGYNEAAEFNTNTTARFFRAINSSDGHPGTLGVSLKDLRVARRSGPLLVDAFAKVLFFMLQL